MSSLAGQVEAINPTHDVPCTTSQDRKEVTMAATFSPSFVIDITDTISNGQTATITLPRGSWNLSSVTTTGSAGTTTITVGTALSQQTGAATVTLPATDPSVVFTGTITVACGVAGNLNDTVLRLSSAIGQTLTIAVA